MKDKTAKIIRVISIPPVMVSIMFVFLIIFRPDIFKSTAEIIIDIAMLGIFPVLAYPVQKIIPKLAEKGRKGQRTLAFIFSAVGYTIAFIYALINKSTKENLIIVMTYFISVIVLSLLNMVFKIKASGHACSSAGPLIMISYFVSNWVIIPSLAIMALIVWSSLRLKRHTLSQLAFGLGAAYFSFFLALGIILLVL